MRVLISIEHPAWSWQFKKIIKQIASEGDILVLAVKKDGDTELLDDFGISYKCLAGTTGKNHGRQPKKCFLIHLYESASFF